MRRSLFGIAVAFATCTPAYAAGDQSMIIPWQAIFQQLMSSLRVTTAQTDASADQSSSTVKKAKEAAAASIGQQLLSIEIAKAKERYSLSTGQGYKMCQVAPGVATIDQAQSARDQLMRNVASSDSRWMREGGDRADVMSSVIELRRRVYCSESEQNDLGDWCDATLGGAVGGGYEAGNTDAAVWLLNRGYGGEEAMTGMDYVDTVAPMPTVPSETDANKSVEKSLDRVRALRSAAFLSGARTGMQNIILDGMQSTEQSQ